MSAYAELAVTTNFSFLRGASDPEEFVVEARHLGHAGIGIADRNSVAGVVRALTQVRAFAEEEEEARINAARTNPAEQFKPAPPFRLAVGARLVFADDTPDILAYPSDRAAWGRLTRLLSMGKLRAEKGDCLLGLADLLEFIEGLNLIVMPPRPLDCEKLEKLIGRLKKSASRRSVWLGATMMYQGDDARRL